MIFALICGGLMIAGNAAAVDVSGDSFYNYARPNSIRLTQYHGNVYDDGGQYQITIARDKKRAWVQTDTDDNPRDRGVELKCKRLK